MTTDIAKKPSEIPEGFRESAHDAPLFERLCARDKRNEFLEHKSLHIDAKDFETLESYITSDDCTKDLQKLLAGEFDYPPPRKVQLRKSHSDRRRTVYAYPERQKNLMKYINWGMLEYDDIFSRSLFSFRQKRGVADVFRCVVRMDYARGFYVAKADVHDYGHSIRAVLLKPMLESIVGPRDPALLAYLIYLLERTECLLRGKVIHDDMGGLPGVPMGSFFNNVYLMELDRTLSQQTTLFCRYADDMAAFTTTQEEAQDAITVIRTITADLGLTLNEEKTQIVKPGESIELLGIQIRDGNLDVSDHTLSKARNKLTRYANKLIWQEQHDGLPRSQAAALMTHRIDRYFYRTDSEEHELSWRDYFFHVITRPDSLHTLDLTCQDLVRRVATGKRGDARYRFRYKDIKSLGYRPLVHEYYRYREEKNER